MTLSKWKHVRPPKGIRKHIRLQKGNIPRLRSQAYEEASRRLAKRIDMNVKKWDEKTDINEVIRIRLHGIKRRSTKIAVLKKFDSSLREEMIRLHALTLRVVELQLINQTNITPAQTTAMAVSFNRLKSIREVIKRRLNQMGVKSGLSIYDRFYEL